MTDDVQVQRILIVRPSALGDVCRSVPVAASLRRCYPSARIDWLVQDDFAPALIAHPAVDGIIRFPRRRFARWWRPTVAREIVRWTRDLRRSAYDLVFDFQGLGRSGFFTWATRAPRRVGYRTARELGWLGYTTRHEGPEATHVVDQMLELLRREGVPPVADLRLFADDVDMHWWRGQRVRGHFIDGRVAVFAPGARWASKRWPASRWAELVRPVLDRGFDRVVCIGAPSEREDVAAVVSGAGAQVVDMVGSTSIGQTLAIIADADLVIANDSAPLHIAVGFDRPCIGLFGPTDPAFVGPYHRPDAVLQRVTPEELVAARFRDRRLGDALMRRIETADVLERVDRILENGRTGRSDSGLERTTGGIEPASSESESSS